MLISDAQLVGISDWRSGDFSSHPCSFPPVRSQSGAEQTESIKRFSDADRVYSAAGDAAALHRPGWFYPSCMVIVGAHYLPFVFLYGMKTFAALAASLVCAGFAIGFMVPDEVVLGGWVGGAILFAFAFALLAAFRMG